MRYEMTTLSIRLGTAPKVIAGVDAWCRAAGAKGTLLGCWATDIGTLNDIIVLRSFADQSGLEAERQRAQTTTDPFGCGESLRAMTSEAYVPFPFLPPVATGKFGPVYEIRTYRLKNGGVPATIAAWEVAVPERVKLSPMVIAMTALDGPPRFTHIWPYADLNGRAATRAAAVAKGIWPPKGGPEWLTGEMRSTIAMATAISPLA